MNHRYFLAMCLMLPVGMAGCAPLLSQAVVSAPNRFNPLAGEVNLAKPVHRLLGVEQEFWVEVGPPRATLLVSVQEPTQAEHPRGTVLLLHGLYGSSMMMAAHAEALTEQGYRAVLVDLRGQGQSSGSLLTYGVQEALDLEQVIDELQRRGLAEEQVGVLGISYGAATAIQLAGIDDRVRSVVALAPFANMREEVPHYLQTILPGSQWYLSKAELAETIDSAGMITGVNPDSQRPQDRIRQTRAKVLILHGQEDWLVPPGQGKELLQAGSSNVELVLLPKLGHTTIWLDSSGEVRERSINWFEQHLVD